MAPAMRADPLALDPELARLACLRHLEAGHLRLGGRIDAVGPLRCYTHPLFHWTFFNTARLARPISDDETPALIAAVRDYYGRRGMRATLDVSAALAPPTLAPQLTAAKFTPDRWESLMVRPLRPAPHSGPPSPSGTLAPSALRPRAERPAGSAGGGDGGEGLHLPDGVSDPHPGPLPLGEGTGLREPVHKGDGGEGRLSIHPITASTVDDFVAAWSQGFAVGADTSASQVRSLFERDLATAWEFRLARRRQRPVGTIAYLSLNGVVQLANVSTVPAARRQGVAATLVERCLAEAEARGDWLIYLHAAVGSGAEALYNKLGFSSIDTWTTYSYD